MTRDTFPDDHVHPAVREKISSYRRNIVDEVKSAIDVHDVVVVGMALNPHPAKARKLLNARGIAHHYIGHGSYFSMWYQRLAIKMWTGWPTFPQIFVKGTFIGGASDLKRLIDSGELKTMLASGDRVVVPDGGPTARTATNSAAA